MYALEIENLTKVYPNNLTALNSINLKVAEGDFFALLGPNGAGKSTTIGIVTSLVNKTAGRVTILGHDLQRDAAKVKACIGMVPQEFNLNQFEKVLDIVMNQAGYYGLARRQAYEAAKFYLQKLDLWHKRDVISRALSGGMKRRLMIARALVHDPQVLILDEPTAGVDIELRRSTWDFLQEINAKGKTIILTTHYLEEAENLCRGIAIIDKGQLLATTTVKSLIAKLQYETLILDTKQSINVVPDITDCYLKISDPHTLELSYPKTKGLNYVFAELSKHGLEVVGIRNKTNRLEELFMQSIKNNLLVQEE